MNLLILSKELALLTVFSLIARGTSQDCTLGSELAPSFPSREVGHLLDLDQPATCSGTLEAWNLCYYSQRVPPGTSLTVIFRIWRPISGNRFTYITGHNFTFPASILTSGGPGIVCSSHTLSAGNQVNIQEGDVYGAFLSPSLNTLPIVASLPNFLARRLYRDNSNFFVNLQRNDLQVIPNIGLHLSADIRSDPVTPSASTPSPLTQVPTRRPITTTTTAAPLPPITPTTPPDDDPTLPPITPTTPPDDDPTLPPTKQPSNPPEAGEEQTQDGGISAQNINSATPPVPNTEGSGGGGGAGAVVAAVVIIILAGVFVVLVVLLVYFWRKGRLSCTRGKERILAMDNALYRVGSQHIAPLFKSSPSHRKRSSYEHPPIPLKKHEKQQQQTQPQQTQPQQQAEPKQQNLQLPQNRDQTIASHHSYDFPREIPDGNTYSVPTGIPAYAPNGHEYSIPSNLPAIHTIETQVTIESDRSSSQQSSPHQLATYQQPKGGSDGGGGRGRQEGEGTPQCVVNLEASVMESGDYIYMSNCTEEKGVDEDSESKVAPLHIPFDEEEYAGPEEYQAKMVYDSVQYRSLLKQATADTCIYEEESPYKVPPTREDEIYIFIAQEKIKVIPRPSIMVTEVIGAGHFGEVEKGLWKNTKQNATLEVALKSLPSNGSSEDRVKLLQEATIMGQFSHPNIVQLHGVVSQGSPLILVLEYVENQDLKKYLRKIKPRPGDHIPESLPNLLLSFSEHVALGMHYLASKRLVHRDLAARNILVSKDKICKIADFGMARKIGSNGIYNGNDGKVPLKWTAPEAIKHRKYSTASDVWSYGCLLYEIWSFGFKPYRGLKNEEAITRVGSGYRLAPPAGCPKAIYTLMIQCWHPVSTCRPKYQSVLISLLEEPRKVLHIPQEDAASHSLACILGSTLEAGVKMYPDLQVTYVPNATTQRDPDYEYMNSDTDSDN